MSKRIALFCALLGVLAFVANPAYAEVQNIKVSGDIQALAVHRNNYDLEDGANLRPRGAGTYENFIADDTDDFLQSIVKLTVEADLTDNVSAAVRLANQREWDTSGTASEDIVLDLAYITLKEMLYSPLTMVVGRQNLLYGTGMIIGPGLFQDPSGALAYRDLSSLHGFDAVRAILDYDPWTLDFVAIKLTEGDDAGTPAQGRDDDQDIYGVNLGHRFASYDAEVEGYLFYKKDETFALIVSPLVGGPSRSRTFTENRVYTGGLRGSAVPIENLDLSGEIALQWGEIVDESPGPAGSETPLTRDRQALLANVAAKYNFANVRLAPTLGVEYLYLSGEEAGNDGDFEAWDPMVRSRFLGTIRGALENLFTTNDPADTSGWTNQHTIKASGSLNLGEFVDGLSMDLAYLKYFFAEEPISGADDDIGFEIKGKLTYDYTEDVEFLVDAAWFVPGDYYNTIKAFQPMSGGGMATANTVTNRVSNDTAVSIIGSCKVTF